MHANRSCAPSLRSVPCAAAAKAPTRKDATGRGAMVSAACYSIERIMSGGGVGHSPREQSCGFGRLCMLQSRGNHGRRRRRPQPSGTATALSSALCAMAAAAKATSPLGRPRGAGRRWGWRRWRTRWQRGGGAPDDCHGGGGASARAPRGSTAMDRIARDGSGRRSRSSAAADAGLLGTLLPPWPPPSPPPSLPARHPSGGSKEASDGSSRHREAWI